MTKLLLVRHGQSEWNAMGRWQGKANPPLTDLGKEQAFLAAKKLPDFSTLASSDLVRAKVTAEKNVLEQKNRLKGPRKGGPRKGPGKRQRRALKET